MKAQKLMGQVTPVTTIYPMSQPLAKLLQINTKGASKAKACTQGKTITKETHTAMLQQPKQKP